MSLAAHATVEGSTVSITNASSTSVTQEGEEEVEGKPRMGNYQKLADFMGEAPTMSMFRQFTSLNVQDILFRQAELAYLEDQLQEIRDDERDARNSSDGEKATPDPLQSFSALQKPDEEGNHSLHYHKMLEIRDKLKDYNETLIRYQSVRSLHPPSKHDLNALCHWYHHPRGGDQFLTDVEGDAYNGEQVPLKEFVTMSPTSHRERDAFTMFLADNVATWWQRCWRSCRRNDNCHDLDEEYAGLVRHDHSTFHAVATICATLLASLLPPLSIFVLYFVPQPIDRLGIILAFSALFAIILALFTKARPGEIFAATAAFASVQVVFIGTNGPTNMVPGAS